mgnify:CR=1 FL=1
MHKLVNGKSIVHFLRIDDGITKYSLSKKIKEAGMSSIVDLKNHNLKKCFFKKK